MAKKRTEKSKYPSRYSPRGYVHAAQYITEMICEKKANCNKQELPIKFWELSDWNKYYRYQIKLANDLLKKYQEKAIIKALMDPRTSKTYSLNGPYFIKIIQEFQKQIDEEHLFKKDVEYDFNEKEDTKFESNNDKKSIISKLRELDL